MGRLGCMWRGLLSCCNGQWKRAIGLKERRIIRFWHITHNARQITTKCIFKMSDVMRSSITNEPGAGGLRLQVGLPPLTLPPPLMIVRRAKFLRTSRHSTSGWNDEKPIGLSLKPFLKARWETVWPKRLPMSRRPPPPSCHGPPELGGGGAGVVFGERPATLGHLR